MFIQSGRSFHERFETFLTTSSDLIQQWVHPMWFILWTHTQDRSVSRSRSSFMSMMLSGNPDKSNPLRYVQTMSIPYRPFETYLNKPDSSSTSSAPKVASNRLLNVWWWLSPSSPMKTLKILYSGFSSSLVGGIMVPSGTHFREKFWEVANSVDYACRFCFFNFFFASRNHDCGMLPVVECLRVKEKNSRLASKNP